MLQSFRNSTTIGNLDYDHPRSLPVTVSNLPPEENTTETTEATVDNFVDSPVTETTDTLIHEYGVCALRGYLFKKERFMTWVKLFCIIRNNFLECHKSQGDSCSPVLKLFLPGSELKEGGGDSKKKWAFQVSAPTIFKNPEQVFT